MGVSCIGQVFHSLPPFFLSFFFPFTAHTASLSLVLMAFIDCTPKVGAELLAFHLRFCWADTFVALKPFLFYVASVACRLSSASYDNKQILTLNSFTKEPHLKDGFDLLTPNSVSSPERRLSICHVCLQSLLIDAYPRRCRHRQHLDSACAPPSPSSTHRLICYHRLALDLEFVPLRRQPSVRSSRTAAGVVLAQHPCESLHSESHLSGTSRLSRVMALCCRLCLLAVRRLQTRQP